MIRSIRGIALRFFRANKFIALSSIVSVMLSISLIITMGTFSVNARHSIENKVKQIYGDMDLSVGYSSDQTKVMDKSLLDKITSSKSIKQSSSALVTRLKVDSLNANMYTVGVQNDVLTKSKYHFNENIESNEVIINKELAQVLKVRIGDSILIENKQYKIKELLTDLDATGMPPDIIMLSKDTVQRLMQEKNSKNIEATYVLIKMKENEDILTLANQIREIDSDLRIDVTEEDEFLKSNLASLNIFMIILSVLMLVVTSLMIISNFELFLYKYKNQISIMRSIGATTKQIFKVVLFQCSLINIIGTILGFVLAVISNQFLQKWLEKLFSFQISSLGFDYKIAVMVMIFGAILIEIFMLFPSYKSAKVLPFKIMQDNEKVDFSNKNKYLKFGKFITFISVALILIGRFVTYGEDTRVAFVLIGSLLLILGIFILFPIYLPTLLTRTLPIIKFLIGNTSFVAIKNLIPQVKKNTFVVLTISTMMIIAVFGSALLKTIQKNEEAYLKQEYPTNIIVKSHLSKNSTIKHAELQAEIKKIKSVKEVSTLSNFVSAELKKGDQYVSFNYALADLKEMEKQNLLPLLSTNVENKVVITKDFALQHDLHVGDSIVLGMYSESSQKIEENGRVVVGGIVQKLSGSNVEMYMDWRNKEFNTDFTVFSRLFISSNDEQYTLKQLEELKKQYPELQINSYEQSVKKAKQMFYERWSIFIVVMIVMVFSVMLGVFNTLVNNINSKRKEFAVLRTICIDKRGIIRVIMTQVILYILIGLILGTFAGILLTYAISLIDHGKVYIDFIFVNTIVGVMLGMAFIIFVPFANRIGKRKVSIELNQDNK
ncbi:FtsX-like permease family protein [Bacillus sp. ES1-5]|uniref:ABC transporter permease n=1 Tax=Bacillus sp. ES1-5 TaxID=1502999 RepID=UPI001F0CC1B3|nr:FtsX-like permease family protein [Bacillus sp. ES1-5]